MLFSEPKIPQSIIDTCLISNLYRFSALQRAENSSINASADAQFPSLVFQCSSASRKFLNTVICNVSTAALNVSVLFSEPKIPQSTTRLHWPFARHSFSALQRAENSSITVYARQFRCVPSRFQCSSASRKFLNLLK